MKLNCLLKKQLCVLLASLFLFSCAVPTTSVSASVSAEEEKAALEQRIKETEGRLAELKEKSAGTQEYLNTLNDKIVYLEKQIDLVSNEVSNDKKQIEELKIKTAETEKAIENAQRDISSLSVQLDEANEKFSESYQQYCKRVRAMYVSGETSLLAFLLTSSDISAFLTRFEMVKRVSQSDSDLLSSIDGEIEEINSSKEELTRKTQELEASRVSLAETKKELEAAVPALEEKQKSLSAKRAEISSEYDEANALLKTLNEKTGNYTEYLQNDKELMQELDEEILAAAKEYENKTQETTTQATTSSSQTTKPASTTKSTTASASSILSLTYPVPSQTTITCAFHGYSGHSGADFSCPTGSTVVAAESGTVIISSDLVNADGTYRSYGRYIVIMHDKKTASGQTVYTLYAHNSSRLVSEGQYVSKGQAIAKSGSTGNSTGPHLHFEVRTPTARYVDCVDPAEYLP